MQLLDDVMLTLERGAPRRPATPTTHHITYIPISTHDGLHYVQHCSSESGLLLTTFGVFHLLRRQHHTSLMQTQAHDGPSLPLAH